MSEDRAAVEQLLRASKSGVAHVVLHYLYFPSRTAAAESAGQLRANGFETECRLGADGMRWLVLARHEVVPSEEAISSARRVMEDLARSRSGEYDGWEAEVQH